MEEITGKLEALLGYLYSLEKKGFQFVKELAEPYSLAISGGYIPHGNNSESWGYSISVSRTYLLSKDGKPYAALQGQYRYFDSSSGDGEFNCIALLHLPEGKNPGEIKKDEVRKSIREFYQVVKNKPEKNKPWWFMEEENGKNK